MEKPSLQKINRIIHCGLELLRNGGDNGLTMRQVAVHSQMSLSNVQHYFKTKEALLQGMIDYYLKICMESLEAHLKTIPSRGRGRLAAIISFSLDNSQLEDMCKVFKEFWAMADRNPVLGEHLVAYYKFFVDYLIEELKSIAPKCPDVNIQQAVGLIVPCVEGYSITRAALPLDSDGMAAFLTDQVMSLISVNASIEP